MFESIVASVINRILGKYIDNLQQNQLNVGIWSGEVILNDLILKKEALDGLDLPIEVSYGCLGEFVLMIPWQSIKTKPIHIIMRNVHVMVKPKTADSLRDPHVEIEKAFRRKMQQIEMSEILAAPIEAMMTQETDPNTASFTYHLITKMIDNLHFQLDSLHIRYVDPHDQSLCFGLYIESMKGTSADKEWHTAASPSTTLQHGQDYDGAAIKPIRKILHMTELCIYRHNQQGVTQSQKDMLREAIDKSDPKTFQKIYL
jgi:vacuolar protein sorting-associated protein 13A/C